jgi:hypothetical protein
MGVLLRAALLGRTRARPNRVVDALDGGSAGLRTGVAGSRVSPEEIKTVWGVKIIFGVAVINLVVLGSELAMNVIRTAFG